MTIYADAQVVAQAEAVEFIRLSDVLRVLAIAGREPGEALLIGLNDCRDRLDAARRAAVR